MAKLGKQHEVGNMQYVPRTGFEPVTDLFEVECLSTGPWRKFLNGGVLNHRSHLTTIIPFNTGQTGRLILTDLALRPAQK